MIAEEKAAQLFVKYNNIMPEVLFLHESKRTALTCATIEVDAIINALESFCYHGAFYDDFENNKMVNTSEKNPTEYWQEVKSHLLKM